MSTQRVYDLPTRLFHWLFAASFLAAFTISNTVDDDDAAFSFHMIAGLLMCFTLLWRIVWGAIGSRHARFSDFSLNPAELASYLKGIFSDKTRLWPGHNPASSWAAVIMMALGIGLGTTGYLMVSSGSESLEDVHELMANAFIIIVLLHIAGIIIHTLKHKDPIGKSIVTGNKQHISEKSVPVASHTMTGVILLVLTIGFGGYLLQNFDSKTRVLT
ncbi:MAG: cytochrome b/b6 domain-containing protein, partial [Spongiibacteraceae bacterium]